MKQDETYGFPHIARSTVPIFSLVSQAIIFHRFHVAATDSVHRYSNSFGDYNDQSNCVAHNGSHFDKIKATGWVRYYIAPHVSTTPGDFNRWAAALPGFVISTVPAQYRISERISCFQTIMSRCFETTLLSLRSSQGIVMIKISSKNSFTSAEW